LNLKIKNQKGNAKPPSNSLSSNNQTKPKVKLKFDCKNSKDWRDSLKIHARRPCLGVRGKYRNKKKESKNSPVVSCHRSIKCGFSSPRQFFCWIPCGKDEIILKVEESGMALLNPQ
jgi:hypothetical protein